MRKPVIGPTLLTLMVTSTCSFACLTQVLQLQPDAGGGTGGAPSVNCTADPVWLTATPAPTPDAPPAHPADECPFYQGGFQYFLSATAPDGNGDPAFASYATADDVFTRATPLPAGALAAPGTHRGTSTRAWLGNIKQPGTHGTVVDQNRRTLYFGVHVNPAFVDFVNANGLQTATAIQHADPNLAFPPGVVTLQSAWTEIDVADGAGTDSSRFITTRAWVSTLRQDPTTGVLSEDRDHPRQIRVALLALHVAYALPGHPELIWTTFEHVDTAGVSDVAPDFTVNASAADPTNQTIAAAVSARDFLLYRAGTPANRANTPYVEGEMGLNEATQSFAVTTSIYRMFPASRSHTILVSPGVSSLNRNVQAMFVPKASTLDPADRRAAYRLVGGIWLDKPRYFAVGASFQNALDSPFVTGPHVGQDGVEVPAVNQTTFVESMSLDGTDSPYSLLGGQDRLSSTAIEAFTQASGNFNNCLTCHNTQATTANGIPAPRDPTAPAALIAPKAINMSHVFSHFVLDECGASGACAP